MNEYYDLRPLENVPQPESTEDEFFGHGWSVRHDDGKYTLSWISGELAGRAKEISITADEYHAVRAGKVSFERLCSKYRVS